MDLRPLKLVMVQGPREGQTLEFGAGSTVRIGRIVRGNNLTIKDAGISSKHVFIGFESGRWIIRDLDSSNGTLLNSSKLTPQTSYPISHGDTIKLGEYTSILVKIDELDSGNPPKITGQEGNARSSNVEGLIEDKSHNTAQILEHRRRGLSRKGGVLKNEIKSLGIPEPESQQMSVRVTRSRKNLSVNCAAKEIEGNKIKPRARRGRPLGRKPPEIVQVDNDADDKENVKEKYRGQEPPPESVGGNDIKGDVKGLTMQEENFKEDINQSENNVTKSINKVKETEDLENRRRRLSRKGGALKDEIKSLAILEPEWQQMSARVTQSRENLSVDCASMEIEGNKIRREARREIPLRQKPLEIIQVDNDVDDKENVKESNLEEKDCEEDKKERDRDQEPPLESVRVDGIKENAKGFTMQEENCKENINQSENGAPESINEEEETLDLEKMTLGQWFDYMEVHLQKQIIEETEVLIEGMKQKAERVHAYMMQQKKAKEKEKGKGKDVFNQCNIDEPTV